MTKPDQYLFCARFQLLYFIFEKRMYFYGKTSTVFCSFIFLRHFLSTAANFSHYPGLWAIFHKHRLSLACIHTMQKFFEFLWYQYLHPYIFQFCLSRYNIFFISLLILYIYPICGPSSCLLNLTYVSSMCVFYFVFILYLVPICWIHINYLRLCHFLYNF